MVALLEKKVSNTWLAGSVHLNFALNAVQNTKAQAKSVCNTKDAKSSLNQIKSKNEIVVY